MNAVEKEMRELQQELRVLDNQVQLSDNLETDDSFQPNTGFSVSEHILESENFDLNFPEKNK